MSFQPVSVHQSHRTKDNKSEARVALSSGEKVEFFVSSLCS